MAGRQSRRGWFYVYIVRCTNGAYYTGYTRDVSARLKLHNSGKGAKYLRGKGPVELVFKKTYRYAKRALREERRIKRLSREQKIELINGAYRRHHKGGRST